jgi:hypothetical protein
MKGFRADTRVVAPSLSIAGLLAKFKTQLQTIRPAPAVGGDKLPTDIAKLFALRSKLLKEKQPDIFAQTTTVPLKHVTMGNLTNIGLGHLVPPGVIPVVPGEEGTASLTSPFAPVSPTLPVAPLPPTAISGVLTGQFKNTKQQGSYNVVVTANGTSPISNTRFVRTELVSVLVK